MLVGARYWSESFLERRNLLDNFPLGKDGHTAGLGRIKNLDFTINLCLKPDEDLDKGFRCLCMYQLNAESSREKSPNARTSSSQSIQRALFGGHEERRASSYRDVSV
jgi:hypothetical protein